MVINAYGVLSDHLGRVFLHKQVGGELLSPPGRPLGVGQLPTETVAAAFKESTGLVVLPIRLTGLYFQAGKINSLAFYFRCIMRGGDLSIPTGEPEGGFFDSQPLPQPMLSTHEHQIEQALHHPGGRPHWETQSLSLGSRLRRMIDGRQPEPTATEWKTHVTVLGRNAAGQLLWLRDGTNLLLPQAASRPGEAPWETAQRALDDVWGSKAILTQVPITYIDQDQPRMRFVFTADLGASQSSKTTTTTFFAVGEEPDNCFKDDVERAAEAHKTNEATQFQLA